MFDVFLIIISMFLWGANWTAGKLISTNMSPNLLVFFRFVFTSLFFIPILLFTKQNMKMTKKSWIFMAISSALMGLYQYLFFKGLETGLAGEGGILVTTLNPIFTFVLSALLMRKQLNKFEYLGLFLGLGSGVFFLKLWAFDLVALSKGGTFEFLLASFIWALVTILRPYIHTKSLPYTFYLFLLITPFMAMGSSVADLSAIFTQNSLFYICLIQIAFLGTIVSSTGFFYITQKRGAKSSSAFIFLVPFFAVLISYFVLGELLSLTTILGGLLAILGMLVLQYSQRHNH